MKHLNQSSVSESPFLDIEKLSCIIIFIMKESDTMKKYIIAVLAALLCLSGCASSTAYSASSAAEETECSHVWSAATCVALS